MGYYLIAAVSLVILTTVVRIPSTQGTHHPDRFCVRNFGCDTDFQDMALGVSLFLNYQVLHESDYSIRDHA